VLARGSRGGERGIPGRTLFPDNGSAKERFLYVFIVFLDKGGVKKRG
jgi:hypothetical protein